MHYAILIFFPEGGQKYNNITIAITYFLTKSKLPCHLVESTGFKVLMKTIAPLYRVPSQKSIAFTIDKVYEILAAKAKKELEEVNSMVLTCDIWTDINMQAYVGVTAHYISKFEMQSLTLGVIPLHEAHTSVYISSNMEDILIEWRIKKEAVFKVISDRANNMILAVELCFGKNKQIPCFAHKLQSVVNDAINEKTVEQANSIGAAKLIVAFFTRKVNAVEELEKMQVSMNELNENGSTSLKLKKYCHTRWNSVFAMIERLIILWPYVSALLLKFKNNQTYKDIPKISDEELVELKEICTILKPFDEVNKSQTDGV